MAGLKHIKGALNSILIPLFSEATLTQSATYKLLSSRAHSPANKRTVLAYTDSTVTLVNVAKASNVEAVSPVDVQYQTTGADYLIMDTDLPSGFSTKDKIEINGKLYAIESLIPYLGVCHGIVLEAG